MRAVNIAGVLLALFATPALAQDISAPRLHVLYNGLRVITVEDPSSPVVTTTWSAHVGDSAEPPDFAGNSHYLEHLLLFRGTEQYPGNAIGEWVAGRGGYFNGHTWYDYTTFEIMSSPADLDAALDRHEQMMFHAAFSGQDFETEKKAVFEELRSGLDRPFGYLNRAAPYHMYPGDTFYSRNTIGSIETVQAATVDRVRRYYKDYYIPNNMTLAVVGDIDTDAVLAAVEARFGRYPRAEVPPTRYQPMDLKPGVNLVTEERDVGKAYFMLAFTGPRAGSPEYFPYRVLTEHLAGGRTSVLYSELVTELELIDDVYMSAWPRRYPSGWQLLNAEGEPADVATAVDAIWQRLARVAQDGISAADLELARKRQQKEHRERLDDQYVLASSLVESDAHGDYRLFSEFEDRLTRVTAADVRAVARKYLNPQHFFMMSIFPPGTVPGGLEDSIRANAARLAGSSSAVMADTLDSGLTLISEARPGAALEGITVAVRAGERYGEHAGAATAVLNMVARETAHRSRAELQNYLDEQGFVLDAWTDPDAAYLRLQAPAGSTGTALELLTEMLTEPGFSQAEWDATRNEMLAALQSETDQPQRVARDLLTATAFEGTPYGRSIEDSKQSLERLSVRDLHAFWQQHYRAGAMAVSYSGPASRDALAAGLAPLANLDGRSTPAGPVALRPLDGPVRRARPMEGRAQANLYIAWPAPPITSEDWVLWELAQKAIGGDLAGRLWKLRQEEGLAYSVWMDGLQLAEQPLTNVYMATAGAKHEAALAAVHREVARAVAGLDADELERVKVSYLAQLNRIDRMASRRSWRNALWWVQGHPPTRREDLERIVANATLESVNRVVRSVLDPEAYVHVEAGMVPE